MNINLDYVTPSNNDFGFTDATLPLDNTNNEQVSEITGSSISQNDLQIENQPITVLDQQEMDDDIQVISVNSVVDYVNEAVIVNDINNIEDVVNICKENNITH